MITKEKNVLITGSGGLIGSEAVKFFCKKGFQVIGIDNDMRSYFFGPEASTEHISKHADETFPNFTHYTIDIRDETAVNTLLKDNPVGIVIHTAAQPSHDWAAREPITDFTVNANGTLILLEACRKHAPEVTFIFTSTNKVYGDTPNFLSLVEKETRYEIEDNHIYLEGIDESMSIDKTMHSLFGSSKVAADILVQEYGKYFQMKTVVFRGGCLTGPHHQGAQLHGFLSYLVKCVATEIPYTIFGYKGKQVRDNIHAHDLIEAFWCFCENPRMGEVYNIGGGRFSNVSMLEAIDKVEKILGKKAIISYQETARQGDHIWYISDLKKFKTHYPEWTQKYSIDSILEEMCAPYQKK